MKIAIIVTTPDYAGINIKGNLLNLIDFKDTGSVFDSYPVLEKEEQRNHISIYTTDERCLYLENLQDRIDADIFFFPTTHRSESNTKTLSCHTQGNWHKADMGGRPNNLSYAPAFFLKKAYNEIVIVRDEMGLDYEATLECTHHGPQIEAPTMFIEIGSTEKEWKDKKAGEAIARVIAKLISFSPEEQEWKPAIGIGGNHYCNTFNKIMERTDIAIGHVCPRYMLDSVDKDMIKQAFDKTVPRPGFAVLDWKGISKFKEKVKRILEELNIPYERTDQILKNNK